jgi:pimeloyl-ACP methyl ester carboxylesterase
MIFGQMARHPLPDDLVRAWTEPLLTNPAIRRDLLAYCRTKFRSDELVQNTEALANFKGEALVLWSPDNRVMPPEHGRRLADLLPTSRYAEIPGAYVLSMLDEPEAVAREIGNFLTTVVNL